MNIPSSVTAIGSKAFYGCTNLTEINIPDGVTEIGGLAFYRCEFTEVTIPASVTKIGARAFVHCTYIQSVTFDDPVGWYDYDTDDEIDVSDRWSGIYKQTN